MQASATEANRETLRTYAERAARLAPKDWRSQVLRGKLLLAGNQTAAAAAASRDAATANPAEPSPRYLLATTRRQIGAVEDSRKQFEAFRAAREKEKARKFRTLVVEIQRREAASP